MATIRWVAVKAFGFRTYLTCTVNGEWVGTVQQSAIPPRRILAYGDGQGPVRCASIDAAKAKVESLVNGKWNG